MAAKKNNGLRIDRAKLEALPPAERKQIERALAQLEAAVKANPLLGYNRPGPGQHLKQMEFHRVQRNGLVRLLLGGNRGGKTTAGVVDNVIQLVDRDVVPEHLQHVKFWDAPFRLRVVTVDFKQSHEVIIDKFKEWTPVGQLKGGSWRRAYDTLARRLWFKNGSYAEFMSQEQDKTAFQGTSLHRVHFDEEPKYDHGKKIWNECMARLIDEDGDTVVTMTPLLGMSWVYDDLYIPATSGTSDKVIVTTVSTDENPNLSQAGIVSYFESLGTMSEAEARARKKGEFTSLSGMIYPEWDAQVHVVPALKALPPLGPFRRWTVACIDPGAANPRVVFLFADDAGRVTVFEEIVFAQGASIKQVSDAIREALAGWECPNPSWFVIDPSARNREQATGTSVAQEYAKNNIPTRPGNNTRPVGIGRQKALLENPGFFRVTENCTEIRKEFPKYRWKESQRTEDATREQAVKRDDHSLDAARYGIMSLPEPQLAGVNLHLTDEVAGRSAGPRSPFADRQFEDGGPGIWL